MGAFWNDSVEEGLEAVRHLASINVDIIKIWVDDRNGMYEKLTPEMYGAIINEANNLIYTMRKMQRVCLAQVSMPSHMAFATKISMMRPSHCSWSARRSSWCRTYPTAACQRI